MDLHRPLPRVLHHADRLLSRLNALLSVLYITLVVVLHLLYLYVYARHLHPSLSAVVRPASRAQHAVLTASLFVSSAVNYLLCVRTPPGTPCPDAESGAPNNPPPSAAAAAAPPDDGPARTRSEAWRWCPVCRIPKPPRAHHCSACNACYLRLCHHCPAVGGCVARDNYPYFFRFLLSAWAAALLIAATAAFLANAPAAAARNPRLRDVVFFTGVAASAVAVAVGVLAGWHLYLVGTGQTTIEWLENLQLRRGGKAPPEWGLWGGAFNRGVRDNVREMLGDVGAGSPWWWIVVFLPLGRRRVVGDGVGG